MLPRYKFYDKHVMLDIFNLLKMKFDRIAPEGNPQLPHWYPQSSSICLSFIIIISISSALSLSSALPIWEAESQSPLVLIIISHSLLRVCPSPSLPFLPPFLRSSDRSSLLSSQFIDFSRLYTYTYGIPCTCCANLYVSSPSVKMH